MVVSKNIKKGFTLVELLAVIVILAIILAIAVPSISSILSNSAKSAFEIDAKMIIKAANYKQIENSAFDPLTVTKDNIKDKLGLSGDNYQQLNFTIKDGKLNITVVGVGKWNGYTAYGTIQNMTVVNSSDFVGSADNSGASAPELASNMISVMYYNGNWVKADKDNLEGTYSWYDYGTKKWANAVTVTSSTLSTYQNAALGTIVNESDILTYLVWIPRYKYAIPAGSGARSINIVFEGNTVSKSSGTAVDTSYLTHPAFTFDSHELNGFWVGKFEITGTINAITIKPNLTSLKSQTVASFYTGIRNMEASGNAYSFNSNEVDTHMMLNSEWGAVAYLSMSTFGLNSEIYKNNSSSYYTGRSGGNVGGSQVLVGSNEYINTGFYTYDGKCATTTTSAPGIDTNCTSIGATVSDTSLSYKASATGNIYGVYDMSGGATDYVMGNFQNYSGYSSSLNSGFNGTNGYDGTTVTTGTPFPNNQYYNLYTTTDATTACNGGICYGQALSETSGWYSDYAFMINASNPWLMRGGDSTRIVAAGAFCFRNCDGGASAFNGARMVVALTD